VCLTSENYKGGTASSSLQQDCRVSLATKI
jgi:hypothetical protein